MKKEKFIVVLFYKFKKISKPEWVANKHLLKCREFGLTGRMILAHEGVNATFEGKKGNIQKYKKFLKTQSYFKNILIKESVGTGHAFSKLSVKVRDEVVTLGAGEFDVKKETAKAIEASELEKMYKKNEDFIILDMRNDYEIAAGRFEKTIDPRLSNFRDLPKKLKELAPLKNKKVITVCTGGIRCEKATCLLKREGFTDLYQLKDGIHTYMKKYPGKNFKGTLFVFDNRMTTDVVTLKNKTIIGRCIYCEKSTENYCSDDTTRPSKKILCCMKCLKKNKIHLRLSSEKIEV